MPEVSKKTDNELIEEIKKNSCNDSFKELFERHKKIYYDACSYFTGGNSPIKYSEVIDDSYYVFNWVVSKFNPLKNTKFSTLLYIYSKYYCLNQISKIKKKNDNNTVIDCKDEDMDLIVNSQYNINNNPLDINGASLFKDEVFTLLDKLKDKRIKKIFQMRFYGDNEESKWKNISSELDLTPQRVHMLYNKGIDYLNKEIEK